MCDLPRSNSIKASVKAIESRALKSNEEHSIRGPNNRLKPSAAAEKSVRPRGLAVTLDRLGY